MDAITKVKVGEALTFLSYEQDVRSNNSVSINANG